MKPLSAPTLSNTVSQTDPLTHADWLGLTGMPHSDWPTPRGDPVALAVVLILHATLRPLFALGSFLLIPTLI